MSPPQGGPTKPTKPATVCGLRGPTSLLDRAPPRLAGGRRICV